VSCFSHNDRATAHLRSNRYLEDYIASISYKPASTKPNRQESEEEKYAFRDYFSSQGLGEEAISAIHNITRAERIDYQVIFP
jgi:hypothetical protein